LEESFAVSLWKNQEEFFYEGILSEETKSFSNQNDFLGFFFNLPLPLVFFFSK
jgi:hypothetical protein